MENQTEVRYSVKYSENKPNGKLYHYKDYGYSVNFSEVRAEVIDLNRLHNPKEYFRVFKHTTVSKDMGVIDFL